MRSRRTLALVASVPKALRFLLENTRRKIKNLVYQITLINNVFFFDRAIVTTTARAGLNVFYLKHTAFCEAEE